MIEPFVCQPLPVRVIFGAGTLAQFGAEVERLGARRALVLSTPGRAEAQASAIAASLGDRSAGVFAGAVMHTPVEVTERALEVVEGMRCRRPRRGRWRLDHRPRQSHGAPRGPTADRAADDLRRLGDDADSGRDQRGGEDHAEGPEGPARDRHLRCRSDPGPPCRHFGRLGHERDRARRRGPLRQGPQPNDLAGGRGGHCVTRPALPRIVQEPRDRDARSDALYGAWLCGVCLGTVGMALHHKLCHVLGGTFDLPHAETHTIILPHAVAYNAAAAPAAMARVARALGTTDAAQGPL